MNDLIQEIVVDVDFYPSDKVPERIMDYAIRKDIRSWYGDIVAVKTIFMMYNPPKIRYAIERVGRTPAEIKAYMHKLAKDDGCDLNEAVKRAFGDDE